MQAHKQTQVIVVEDDPDVRDSLSAIITAFGHQCVAFDSAELALGSQDWTQCDCLLVDHNLPGMNGADLLIKLHQTGDAPPACLYTGRIDSPVLDAASGLNNTLVLEKGNDPDLIAKYMQRLITENN